jgi:hypothetical protein
MAAKRKGNTLNIINGFFGEQIEVDKSIYSNEKLYENVTGKNRIEKVLKDMTADKIDFTQKKLPYKFSLQESESKENGLCQVWSLFFIYYYMTGKIEEIFTKFSDIQRMIDRKILDYSVFTEILRTWLYLHTEIKISRKKLHLRIKKSKKSKKSKSKKSKSKKNSIFNDIIIKINKTSYNHFYQKRTLNMKNFQDVPFVVL